MGAELANLEDFDVFVVEKFSPLEEIFRLLDQSRFEEIIAEALASPASGSLRSARQSLNSAIDACKEIKIRGFAPAVLIMEDI